MGRDGARPYDPSVVKAALTTDPRRPARLSVREREVLALTAQGLSNKDVAQQLAVSVHGVKFHLATIYRKLGVGNRTEATAVYLTSLRDEAR